MTWGTAGHRRWGRSRRRTGAYLTVQPLLPPSRVSRHRRTVEWAQGGLACALVPASCPACRGQSSQPRGRPPVPSACAAGLGQAQSPRSQWPAEGEKSQDWVPTGPSRWTRRLFPALLLVLMNHHGPHSRIRLSTCGVDLGKQVTHCVRSSEGTVRPKEGQAIPELGQRHLLLQPAARLSAHPSSKLRFSLVTVGWNCG